MSRVFDKKGIFGEILDSVGFNRSACYVFTRLHCEKNFQVGCKVEFSFVKKWLSITVLEKNEQSYHLKKIVNFDTFSYQ